MGVVVMNECTFDVEPVNVRSCPCSSNGQFCGLIRMNGVHTSLDYCVLLAGMLHTRCNA